MKFVLALVASAFTTAAATSINQVKADSKFGKNLLSKARRVEDGQYSTEWMADMSLKFMGCHHISQWNSEADGGDDVHIESRRLAKFRLCPTNTCKSGTSNGCSAGYGDYIVDMDDYLYSYLENKEEVEQEQCEYAEQYSSGCNNDDNYDNCVNKYFKKNGMTYCLGEDYYQQDDNEGDAFEINNYLECAEWEPAERRRRRLEQGYYDGDEQAYYIGTYCSNQGGDVVLGVFTDDTCTNFADSNGGRSTYYQSEGQALPYSESSIVDDNCWSCEDKAEEGDDGYYQQKAVKQTCEDVHYVAGKCEQAMYGGDNANVNNNACQYIDGVKTTGSSGIINSAGRGGNSVASAFIGIFMVGFVLLGSYVYYLKTKLDRGRINLSD